MTSQPQPKFLDYKTARCIADEFGTPVYVYDKEALLKNAADAVGLLIDASSGYEVWRALAAGISAKNISLSAQELPDDFAKLYEIGIEINACSLNQLERFGQAFPGCEIGLRFNPGKGSGGNNRTNVGGLSSSFGIWYEYINEVKDLIDRYKLKAIRVHTHIGSGSDPAVWQKVSEMSLNIVRQLPGVVTLNLGGGYKVARMADETGTDLQECGAPVAQKFRDFAKETGREIHLEIEPGTFLVANAGSLLCKVQDIVSTGEDGYTFLKLNSGMTEILRPSLYGAQHPIYILQSQPSKELREYMVVGHCCESGDILTPAPGDPELLAPRKLPATNIGDLCVIDGAGAYCSAMAAKHYNSYPEAAEVLLDEAKVPHLIRKRQQPEELWANEVENVEH